jgi:hypothetical protein
MKKIWRFLILFWMSECFERILGAFLGLFEPVIHLRKMAGCQNKEENQASNAVYLNGGSLGISSFVAKGAGRAATHNDDEIPPL